MTRHVLAGLQRATRVTCDTAAIRDELMACGIVPADRAVVARVGVGPDYSSTPDPERDCEADRLIGAPIGSVVVLHVGRTIPRKRIDVLLKVCGQLRHSIPNLRLVRVGGDFTPEQRKLVRAVGMDGRISNLEFVDDRTLAAIYRRAALALLPSEREGFGLPLIEAMACGTPIHAERAPRVAGALARPPRSRSGAGPSFYWAQFASRVAQVYRQVAAEAADPMPIRTSA